MMVIMLWTAWSPLCAGLVAPTRAVVGPARTVGRPLDLGRVRVRMHGGHAPTLANEGPHPLIPSPGGVWALAIEQADVARTFWRTFRRHALSPRLSSRLRQSGAGSQVTLLGAAVNLVLSCSKALAGFYGNSAAMMCDAAHSFSDLLSDGLTLLALRMGSLPPDDDHPYGHGRFEALGCLGIGWMLLLTAASFGSSALAALRSPVLVAPGRIALWAALASIVSKEALFRVTDRVGKELGSAVITANAWHHRSDALSSVVAVLGIGGAILGLPVLDPLCGVAVAGLVGYMGGQIIADALYRLSDTADPAATEQIVECAQQVPGVLAVGAARCRWMSSNVAMADLCVMVGPMTTASAAQRLAAQVRTAVMADLPDLAEVLVRTQTMCPLLDATSDAPMPRLEIEARVENVLRALPSVHAVPSISVRYINGGELAVDVAIEVAPDQETMSVAELRHVAVEARAMLLEQLEPLRHASIATSLVS